jgi:hypothetical protein
MRNKPPPKSHMNSQIAALARRTEAKTKDGPREIAESDDNIAVKPVIARPEARRSSIVTRVKSKPRSALATSVEWYRYSCFWHILKETLKGCSCGEAYLATF